MKKFIEDLLKALIETSGGNAGTLTFNTTDAALVSAGWEYFAGVGMALTILYFLLEMNRKYALEGGDMTFKSFFAPFLKLMIAIGVISMGGKIVGYILDINNAFIRAASNNEWFNASAYLNPDPNKPDVDPLGSALSDMVGGVIDALGPLGTMAMLGLLLPLLLTMLINIVLKLVWMYKGLLYKLELAFRVCFAPIALADVYSGQSATAIRYLKGLLVLGIYGGAMCVLPTLATLIGASNLLSGIEDIIKADGAGIWKMLEGMLQITLLGPFAALSACNAVKTAAKEALGA